MKNNTLIFIGMIAILIIVGFTCLQKSKKERLAHLEGDPLIQEAEQAPIRMYNVSPQEAPQPTTDYEIIGDHQNNFMFGSGASDKTTSEYDLI